ncbi:MAG: DUF167 domain-containing protein [Patescibacteria group bacterium]
MWYRLVPGGLQLNVKVVPGATASRVVGVYGDCLKVQVAAPPERGRANDALARMVADQLGVHARYVSVVRGMTRSRKVVEVVAPVSAVVKFIRQYGGG